MSQSHPERASRRGISVEAGPSVHCERSEAISILYIVDLTPEPCGISRLGVLQRPGTAPPATNVRIKSTCISQLRNERVPEIRTPGGAGGQRGSEDIPMTHHCIRADRGADATRDPKKRKPTAYGEARPVSNIEIVTLAVFLLNGDSAYVDTEDVAVKANSLAPGRFAWRRYPDQINLEIVRVYLSDAKKKDKGMFLIGSGREGWMLTEKGLRFARKAVSTISTVALSRAPLSPRDQRIRYRERGRMLASDSFTKFSNKDGGGITAKDAEAIFRLDDYVVGKARDRKIIRLLNMFNEDDEIGPMIRAAANVLRGSCCG